jgi:hypothetical protein
MAFKTIASYEVLGQPIAPVPNVPYIQQGSFLQISNLDAADKIVDIEYVGTPVFQESYMVTVGSQKSTVTLFANMITQNGNAAAAMSYSITEFLISPIGFKAISIPGRSTFLFGVQYLLTSGAPLPPGIDSRGFIRLQAPPGTKLLVLATTRQVFTNYAADGPAGTVTDISENAYSVPLVGGPEVSF